MVAGGYFELEKGTTPGAAATGKIRIYPSSVDDLWHEVDEAGTDTVFSGATGATGATGPAGPGVPPTVTAHGAMGAAETFDYDSGDQTEHSGTLDANCTFTFTNPAATGSRSILVLQLAVDGGGPYTVTLPASVSNKTEAEAVLAAVPASATIIIPFTTIDGGTTWIAMLDDAGGSSDLDAIITASSGQDIADALAGAAAPDAGNVFATMADVGGGGGITRNTVGTTSLGASFDNTLKTVYKKITLASAGFLASVAVGIKGQSSDGAAIDIAIMSDNAGTPLNVIASGGSSTTRTTGGVHYNAWRLNSTARFITMPVGVWLTAGDYWIGVVAGAASGNDAQLAYSSGTGSDRTKASTDGVMDQSAGGSSAGTDDYSIFANILT